MTETSPNHKQQPGIHRANNHLPLLLFLPFHQFTSGNKVVTSEKINRSHWIPAFESTAFHQLAVLSTLDLHLHQIPVKQITLTNVFNVMTHNVGQCQSQQSISQYQHKINNQQIN